MEKVFIASLVGSVAAGVVDYYFLLPAVTGGKMSIGTTAVIGLLVGAACTAIAYQVIY